MKTTILLSMLALALFSCNANNHKPENYTANYSAPDVIPIDSANKMLISFLNSVNYTTTDTNVQSVSFSAALLRKYLDSVVNSDSIAFVKIMFAHKLSYINAGHGNQNAGFSNAAITLLIAGYTTAGNYVYFPGNLVVDNAMLCPNNCPPGVAGNPLFPVSTQKK